MSETKKPFAWQDTVGGLIFIVIVDAFLSYVMVSLAIDSGSLLQYFVAIVLSALTIGQIVKLVKKLSHRDR